MIPVELSYPVIDEWDDATRHGITVRLNMKTTPEVLRAIALELKSREKRQYLRTLIWYKLPLSGDGTDHPWANSHFDPTLKVELSGYYPD